MIQIIQRAHRLGHFFVQTIAHFLCRSVRRHKHCHILAFGQGSPIDSWAVALGLILGKRGQARHDKAGRHRHHFGHICARLKIDIDRGGLACADFGNINPCFVAKARNQPCHFGPRRRRHIANHADGDWAFKTGKDGQSAPAFHFEF